MINNLFDAHVKEQMTNTRPDVPQHIWENIVAKKERKKPVVFAFSSITKSLLTGLLILTAVGIALYLNKNKPSLNKKPSNSLEINLSVKNVESKRIEEQKNTAPTIIANFSHLSVDDKSTLFNTKEPALHLGRLIDHVEKESFLNLENNTETFTDEESYTNTINRKVFNSTLLGSSFFNPKLQVRKFPTNPFIPCPEIEKNAAGSKKYIEIYAGPDYVFRSISDTANSIYLQQRKASIKYLFAYSAGIRYTRVFGSGMSFRTGLNYSQINEQFTSEKGRVIQNIYIINSNGDTTGTFLQSGTLYKTSTNKFKSLDIPITVGYEVGNGRIHTNLNVGVLVNIRSSQKGFVLDKNSIPVDITSGKSSSVYQYKTNAGISFISAASVYYKLNERFHLMAEPYIKLSLSPATKPEITLKEKFHTTGVRLGIRMDF